MRKSKKPLIPVLTLFFILAVFCILSVTMFIVSLITFILVRTGVLTIGRPGTAGLEFLIFVFVAASILIGTFITVLWGRVLLKPINRLVGGMNRLADGDYKTRISLGKHKFGKTLANSFNTLAEELQNTEMLRSDFVNNFSHEFKTPIVSILGFTKLLKHGNLPQQQMDTYLDVIEEESERLAAMATNVLNMAKIENQSILTDVTAFNLSEQLRNCILLLEKKWTAKSLEMIVTFNEHMILANEELLKQVWINLLDNAVKFTPAGGEIEVTIHEGENVVTVQITNTGSTIQNNDQKRIFQKFYQADTSHASEGTGIGLAVVKKIVELHKGEVFAQSDNNQTTFTVQLPRNLGE